MLKDDVIKILKKPRQVQITQASGRKITVRSNNLKFTEDSILIPLKSGSINLLFESIFGIALLDNDQLESSSDLPKKALIELQESEDLNVSMADEIIKLGNLKEMGALTEEEFQEAKKRILIVKNKSSSPAKNYGHYTLPICVILGLIFLIYGGMAIFDGSYKKAIENVVAQSKIVKADSTSLNQYIQKLNQINTRGCPPEFIEAYNQYLNACAGLASQIDSEPKSIEEGFLLGFLNGLAGDPSGGTISTMQNRNYWFEQINTSNQKIIKAASKYSVIIRTNTF